MKTKKEFIAEYKKEFPVLETSGTGTGTYKYERYLDGIDLRYGYDSQKAAEMARAKEAKEQYQYHAYKATTQPCPKCGKPTVNEVLDIMGACWDCEKKNPFYDSIPVLPAQDKEVGNI